MQKEVLIIVLQSYSVNIIGGNADKQRAFTDLDLVELYALLRRC